MDVFALLLAPLRVVPLLSVDTDAPVDVERVRLLELPGELCEPLNEELELPLYLCDCGDWTCSPMRYHTVVIH